LLTLQFKLVYLKYSEQYQYFKYLPSYVTGGSKKYLSLIRV